MHSCDVVVFFLCIAAYGNVFSLLFGVTASAVLKVFIVSIRGPGFKQPLENEENEHLRDPEENRPTRNSFTFTLFDHKKPMEKQLSVKVCVLLTVLQKLPREQRLLFFFSLFWGFVRMWIRYNNSEYLSICG